MNDVQANLVLNELRAIKIAQQKQADAMETIAAALNRLAQRHG